jgi:hypothetical protein
MSKETLDAQFERIGQAANESESHLVEAVLRSENQEGYRVTLSLDAFLALLKSCKPRVIYAFANRFNAREGLIDELLPEPNVDDEEADLDGTDAEKALLANPKVAPLIREFKCYDGKVESFLATFVVDGVLHSVFEQEDWALAFENGVSELKTLLRAERRNSEDAEYEAQRAQMHEHAKTLCAHPKFADGRPSKEKREYLAQSLFPQLDERVLSLIVDEATNMLWLNAK